MNLLIIFLAKYLYLGILAVAALVWLNCSIKDRRTFLVNGLVAAIIGFGLTKLAGALYYHPRPFVVHHATPLIAHAADNGFPSDHTVLTMLVALTVFQVSKRWGSVLVVCSLLVGGARVAAQVHSSLDIAGAIVVASVAVALSRVIAGELLNKRFAN